MFIFFGFNQVKHALDELNLAAWQLANTLNVTAAAMGFIFVSGEPMPIEVRSKFVEVNDDLMDRYQALRYFAGDPVVGGKVLARTFRVRAA